MNFFTGPEIFKSRVENGIYEDTQVESGYVSLTVDAIFDVETRAELDFGGGEYRDSNRREIEPVKRDPDDDYGWWELEAGEYLAKLNETIKLRDDEVAVISPHAHLTDNAAGHVTLHVKETSSITVPLRVPAKGISIKENARLSKLMIFKST